MNEDKLEIKQEAEDASKLGRRDAIKVGAAVAGGLALGLGTYVKPGIVSVGVEESYAVTGGGGGGGGACSPGFWADSPYGQNLWASNPVSTKSTWIDVKGVEPPFKTGTPFNSYFTLPSSLTGYFTITTETPNRVATMLEVIQSQSSLANSQPSVKAAKAVIAAILNASWFGTFLGSTAVQIKALWESAVSASPTVSFDWLASTFNNDTVYTDTSCTINVSLLK